MLYQRPTFSCPASNIKTTQVKWDLAMLTKRQFITKYQVTQSIYNWLASGR